ncbi:MAG: M50 family metallopeptidase [Parasporobacterium sp.]|nr:M50 family metallopeptidase [Parasporobacterium sp.]
MKIDGIEITEIGNDEFVIGNEKKYVKLGIRETEYLLELLGKGTTHGNQDIPMVMSPLSDVQKSFLRNKYEEWGFIGNKETQKKMKTWSDVRIVSFDGKWFESCCRLLSKLFSIKGLILLVISCLAMGSVYFWAGEKILVQAKKMQELNIDTLGIAFAVLFNYIVVFFHESAHASTCMKYSGRIGLIGIKLFYLIPTFFCDVSSMYHVNGRKEKAIVAISGVLTNVFVGNIVFVVYGILLTRGYECQWMLYYYVMNIVIVISNLLPFAKWDGYWFLKACLGEENLYDQSVQSFFDLFRKEKIQKKHSALMRIYGGIIFLFHFLLWIMTMSIIYDRVNPYLGDLPAMIIELVMMIIAGIDIGRFVGRYRKQYKEQIAKESVL